MWNDTLSTRQSPSSRSAGHSFFQTLSQMRSESWCYLSEIQSGITLGGKLGWPEITPWSLPISPSDRGGSWLAWCDGSVSVLRLILYLPHPLNVKCQILHAVCCRGSPAIYFFNPLSLYPEPEITLTLCWKLIYYRLRVCLNCTWMPCSIHCHIFWEYA